MDFTSFPSHFWKTTHNLSHHTYTNLETDIEITAFEPFSTYFLTSQKENKKFAIFV